MKHIDSDTSLSEVNESIQPDRQRKGWRKVFAFFGPAYLVSVGYMDPGNWATDIAGGSQFGYQLIWVLVMSNLMAILLQSFCTRLGIVRKRDLAQCNRDTYPKALNFILYILAELAIAATDLAEVLGMAIGLNLLLGMPLIWGIVITLLDTFLILYLQRLGMRKMEAFIVTLIAIIGFCFFIEMFMVKPDIGEIAAGLKPGIPNSTALYIAIGIIGATVMPHNLYLHSALVQTRKVGNDKPSIKEALRLNNWDSVIALNMALFVNAAILILAAAAFHQSGNTSVASLKDAHQLLEPLLGNKWASHLFAIALITAGQSSTVTGTLAGQIVMEGYLRLRLNPMLRRLLTRLIAIVPAILVILILGESEVDNMLIFSQVLLSMQLAFAIIPLIHFVSDKKQMGEWAIKPYVQFLGWLIASIIVVLNLKLVYETGREWMGSGQNFWLNILIVSIEVGLLVLLITTVIFPYFHKRKSAGMTIHQPLELEKEILEGTHIKSEHQLNTIALSLDFSKIDLSIIQKGLNLAQPHTKFLLIHIVESASARLLGHHAMDAETEQDYARMQEYRTFLESKNYTVEVHIGFKNRVNEIAQIVNSGGADLLIVGSHGHRAIKDFIFGETINKLRHEIKIPMMIVR